MVALHARCLVCCLHDVWVCVPFLFIRRPSYFLNADTISESGAVVLIFIIFIVNCMFLLIFARAIKKELNRKAREVLKTIKSAKKTVRNDTAWLVSRGLVPFCSNFRSRFGHSLARACCLSLGPCVHPGLLCSLFFAAEAEAPPAQKQEPPKAASQRQEWRGATTRRQTVASRAHFLGQGERKEEQKEAGQEVKRPGMTGRVGIVFLVCVPTAHVGVVYVSLHLELGPCCALMCCVCFVSTTTKRVCMTCCAARPSTHYLPGLRAMHPAGLPRTPLLRIHIVVTILRQIQVPQVAQNVIHADGRRPCGGGTCTSNGTSTRACWRTSNVHRGPGREGLQNSPVLCCGVHRVTGFC